MSKVFSGDLVSYANRDNVVDRIKDGAPRTFVARDRRRIIWFASASRSACSAR